MIDLSVDLIDFGMVVTPAALSTTALLSPISIFI